jgi:N-acetylneuraminic acid mutarotase
LVVCFVVAGIVLGGCASKGSWRTAAPAGVARAEVSYTYAPATGRFYLAGGGRTLQQSYDPVADTWQQVASLPAALDHIQSVELNGRMYYIGGLVTWPSPAVGTVYVYDPVADRFTTGTPLPPGRERGAGGVAVHDGKIYYAGGLAGGVAVPWFDVYDPVMGTWTTLPSMPTPRDHFHAAVVGDRFYAVGGRNKSINATRPVNEAFDFRAGAWLSGLAPLPTARGGFGTAVLGNRILIIGGEGADGAYATVEAYDTVNNTWSTQTPMPHARHGIEAASCNSSVYVAGGGLVAGGGQPTALQEVYFEDSAKPCTRSP